MAIDDFGDDGDDVPTEDDLKKQTLLSLQFRRALEEGDGVTAGQSLRRLWQIEGYLKDVLADMLEGTPNLDAKFHWFLKFVGRSEGNPPMPSSKERELEELVWKTVKKHRAHTPSLKATWPKAAQELNMSKGSIIKYYYKREHRKLGDLPDFSGPQLA